MPLSIWHLIEMKGTMWKKNMHTVMDLLKVIITKFRFKHTTYGVNFYVKNVFY